MKNKKFVSFVLLIVTVLMFSGCLLLPVPVGDGDGHRGGGHGGGHHEGGERH